MNEDEQERKAQQVQNALKGLKVEYSRHFGSGEGLTPDMAKVNGYSIIWHDGAYCAGEPNTVEVMSPGADDVDGHVPISELRKMVE